MNNSQKINSVHAIRGIAALSVMIAHFFCMKFSILYNVGSSSVLCFFIISGIVVYVSSIKSHISPHLFMLKRLIRIIPAYYVASIAYVVLCTQYPIYGTQFIKSLLFLPLFSENAPFLVKFWTWDHLGQGWTLNYEMYFYLVVFMCLYFRNIISSLNVYFIITLVILPLFCFYQFIPSVLVTEPFLAKFVYLNIVMSPLNWFFLGGVLIGYCFTNQMIKVQKTYCVIYLALLILIFTIGLFLNATMYSVFSLITMIPIIFLIINVEHYNFMTLVLKNRIFIFLGNISYSLYLWHETVWYVLLKLFNYTTKDAYNGSTYIIQLASIPIAIAISYVAYEVVEVRFSRFLNKCIRIK